MWSANGIVCRIEDVGKEKHVPVIEKIETDVRVKVGSIPHPMEENHYIEWIEVIAEFEIRAENITAREYCNIHGLWKS